MGPTLNFMTPHERMVKEQIKHAYLYIDGDVNLQDAWYSLSPGEKEEALETISDMISEYLYELTGTPRPRMGEEKKQGEMEHDQNLRRE